MKRTFAILALVATVTFASAQDQPNTTKKADSKKETCKKSSKCCMAKADSTAVKKAEIKK